MESSKDWFSRYKFCQPLGQGGMGTIYLAEDRLNNNSPCVIKQLTNRYANPQEHQEAVRLFKREAALLRGLNHPSVVRVFDSYTTEDGRYFLVMDYVQGKNLEIMLRTGGPFKSEHVAWIAIQCCEVLEYLHGQDPPVIYRDMKPSNLMLTPDGQIVLIDFGIARNFMPKEAATRVISAGYSPPEQYSGKPETRSDLYSLGQTMFQLLTGQRPKALSSSAPLLVTPYVNERLDGLVRKLTAQGINDRPPSAQAVRLELYQIYKELLPEFQIPTEEKHMINLDAADMTEEQTTKLLEEEKNTVKSKLAQTAEEVRKSMALRTEEQVSKASEKGKSIWLTIKHWFEILTT